MLVLSRRKGESLIVGDNIEISVIEIQGDNVKIGINAPHNVTVLRKELLDQVRTVNAEAAQIHVSLEDLAYAIKNKKNEK